MTTTRDDRRPGLLRRFANWLFGPVEPPPEPEEEEPPGALSRRKDVLDPIEVPALGDAFNFRIGGVFTWYSEGLTPDQLEYWMSRYTPRARRTLREATADVARTYGPHQASELQDELNQSLAAKSWSQTEDGVTLRYTVRVRVDPDERVREQLRPFWEKRIQMEAEHELGKRRADLVDELTQKWSTILERLEEDPHNRHAARLSEEEFARVLGDFVTERREGIRQIIDLLRDAVNRHGTLDLGPSEYTRAWDAALRSFQRQYGVDGNGAVRDVA